VGCRYAADAAPLPDTFSDGAWAMRDRISLSTFILYEEIWVSMRFSSSFSHTPRAENAEYWRRRRVCLDRKDALMFCRLFLSTSSWRNTALNVSASTTYAVERILRISDTNSPIFPNNSIVVTRRASNSAVFLLPAAAVLSN
jgi:hypothetical protein